MSLFGLFGPPDVNKLKVKCDVTGLIKALNYEDSADVRMNAATALGELRDSRAVDPLITTLKDKDIEVRRKSATALGQIGDIKAVFPLVALLKYSDKVLRSCAIEGLKKMGLPALDLLILSLEKKDYSVRSDAAMALGEIGDARAIKPLLKTLRRTDREVVEALGKLGWKPTNDEDSAWYWIAKHDWKNCIAVGAPAVLPLLEILNSGSGYMRKDAAYALGQIGDPRATESLIDALRDRDYELRNRAIYALGRIGQPAVNRLIEAFKSNNTNEYQGAAEALEKIGRPAVEPLIALLNDENSTKKQRIIDILGKIKDPRSIDPLIVNLRNRNKYVRKTSAEALENLGWTTITGEDGAWFWIAKQDMKKCIPFGEVAVTPLITALSDDDEEVRRGAAIALGCIGDSRAVKPLLNALEDQKKYVQIEAAAALAAMRDEHALDPLISASRDKDWVISKRAIISLGKMGIPAIDPLIALLKDDKHDAVEALVIIGTPAVGSLITTLNEGNFYEKIGAAEALGKIGDNRAVEPLISILKGKDWSMSRYAARALKDLGWIPTTPEESALYYIANENWAKGVTFGSVALDPLISTFQNGIGEVKKSAILSMGQIQDPRSAEVLISYLKEGEVELKKSVINALVTIGNPAIELLIIALKDGSNIQRESAAEVLGKLGNSDAIDPLIAALNDEFIGVGRKASDSLDKLGWSPDKGENGARYWIIKEQWANCISLGSPAIIPLLTALKNRNKKIRKSAAESLISLYQSGQLNQKEKNQIIEMKNVINQPHTDNYAYSDCGHTDEGIGVIF